MKNIIKKIIKEELDDFDWIKQIPANPLTRSQFVVIWFDRDTTKNDIDTITRWWHEINGTEDFSVYNFQKGDYVRFDMDERDDVYDFRWGSSRHTFKNVIGRDKYTEYNLSELIPDFN